MVCGPRECGYGKDGYIKSHIPQGRGGLTEIAAHHCSVGWHRLGTHLAARRKAEVQDQGIMAAAVVSLPSKQSRLSNDHLVVS